MGAILLSPIYLLLNLYLAARILVWFGTLGSFFGSFWFAVLFLACYAFFALSPLFAAVTHGGFQAFTKKLSSNWLGMLMYLLIFLLLSDLAHCIACLLQQRSVFDPINPSVYRNGGLVIFGAVFCLTAYGLLHAARIRRVTYEATVCKDCTLPSLKIALVADLHLGHSVGVRRVRQMAKLIQDMKPDLIVFAGDIFDNDFDAIDAPEEAVQILASLQSTYGAYACWGNHDIQEMILAGFTFDSGSKSVCSDPRMNRFLADAGIRLLEDETLLIENAFYLCGRLDASCLQKSGTIRLTPEELTAGLDHTKPILVIDHQPSGLRELAAAGVDLDLSGHTHDGQMFPGNLTTRIGWMNSRGKLCIDRMTSIVTSGAGVWGPAMRIGTDNEVVEVLVSFRAEASCLSSGEQ